MLPKGFDQLSAKVAKQLGLPDGWKVLSPFPFGGMNQDDARQGMEDTDFWWIENFIKTGKGMFQPVPDIGASLYTNTGNIISFFSYNIQAQQYFIVFTNNNQAVQVAFPSGIITPIAGNFNATISLPACSQWATQYLIIANNTTPNDYWIWDGSLLYTAGTLGPVETITGGGSGYTSAPTVLIFGGSGTGATAQAFINNGSVVSLQITNPGTGYQPGDVPQVLFTGGGSDNAAQLVAVLTAGGIQSVIVTNPGTGYTAGTYALGFSGGGGSSAAGTYTVDATGKVVSTNITAQGSGYTSSPTVAFSSGGGSGAAGNALLTSTSVASVTVVSGGSGYTTTPLLTIVGGGGTGATATAVITGGAISSVTIVSGGTGYSSVPAVEIAAGANRAATASLTIMPFGVSGNSIETFQQRVWLPFPSQVGHQINGATFNVSAPGSVTDFATTDGGVQFTSTDNFLKVNYVNIKQSNGYLYPMGDSSVSVISNVQTSGTPSTTTFNYQNTDPQIGCAWRDTVQLYSRTIIMANPTGVYGLYGGAVTKISKKIDNLFSNQFYSTAANLQRFSAVADIYAKRLYMIFMPNIVDFQGVTRNLILAWDQEQWYVFTQNVKAGNSAIAYIGTQEVNSVLTAWGTDGNSLFPLFGQNAQTASTTTQTRVLSTKLYGEQMAYMQNEAFTYIIKAQNTSQTSALNFSMTIDTEIQSYPFIQNPTLPKEATAYTNSLMVPSRLLTGTPGDIFGVNLGMTLTTTSPSCNINYIGLGIIPNSAVLGSNGLIET